MTAPRAALAVLAGVASASAAGCGAPLMLAGASLNAVGLSAVAYVNGEIQAAEIAPYDRVVEAAKKSLARLKFNILSITVDDNRTYIKADEIGGRTLSVTILRKTEMVTKFTIRFSVLGDQPMSRLLVAVIQEELGHDLSLEQGPPAEP